MITQHVYKDNKIRPLTLHTIFTDKPDSLYWINTNMNTPVIVKIENKKFKDYYVTFCHNGTYSAPGERRIEETIKDYLEKINPTFKDNVAYLIANNTYGKERKVFIDFFNDNWNETTTTIKDIFNNTNNFNWCGVRADLEHPVIYCGSKTNVDYGSLMLIEKFANLSYMDKVSPTAIATDFMLRYIIETEKLNVKAKKDHLYLLERKNWTRVIPRSINTDLIADLWGEFYYGQNSLSIARDNTIPPTLDDILYKDGLDFVTEPIVITSQNLIPEVEYIRITPTIAFLYIVASETNDFASKRTIVETWLEMSELRKEEYSILQIDATALKQLKKETSNVSV